MNHLPVVKLSGPLHGGPTDIHEKGVMTAFNARTLTAAQKQIIRAAFYMFQMRYTLHEFCD